MYFRCDEIERRMNEAGQKRQPFLFGVEFEMKRGFFLVDPMSQQEVLFNINGFGNTPPPPETTPPHHFESRPEDFHTYSERFRVVRNGLSRGDSYLTNLTISTPIRTSLTLQEIFSYSKAIYRFCIPGMMVCFSPECFVTMSRGRIATFPMKGTIDAAIPNAREIILNDHKESAEHNTTVDLLRNDLSRIATEVKVSRFRYIDELQTSNGTILQVSSEIEGSLPDNYREQLGTLFFALLPAGSVSGAPKRATLELIRRAEKEPRGYYTGVAGYFDGERLESFVMIRYIEQQGSDLFFRSGGGITANNICRNEYREALQKVYLPF
ncbi:MAG: aminodeoxychorismate synthase component I [Proteiniphilum sp.]|nr:aminodeoxychorismate synthase component I [Proteiniphilum sp.]